MLIFTFPCISNNTSLSGVVVFNPILLLVPSTNKVLVSIVKLEVTIKFAGKVKEPVPNVPALMLPALLNIWLVSVGSLAKAIVPAVTFSPDIVVVAFVCKWLSSAITKALYSPEVMSPPVKEVKVLRIVALFTAVVKA